MTDAPSINRPLTFRDKQPVTAAGGFLPAVQGLRGIAAATVLAVHLYDMPKGGVYDIANPGFLPPIWLWLQSIMNVGGHGVELFFMISGFLIPASLVRHGSFWKFIRDRVMRIMPVFGVLHLLLFIVGPIVGYKFFRDIDAVSYAKIFLANLFFVPEALGLPIAQQNAWTLTYEWAFYIWFGVTFVAVVQLRNWFLAVPLIALGLVGVVLWPMSAFFVIGMFFGAVNLRIPLKGRLGLLAGVTCGAIMYLTLEYLHPVFGLLPGFLVFGMVLAPGSGVATALSAPFPQYCGKISYSLYLVHPFALFPLQVLGLRLVEHGVNRWLLWGAFVILGIAASLAAGSLGYELIEVRLRRWLDRVLPHLFARPLGGVGRPV